MNANPDDQRLGQLVRDNYPASPTRNPAFRSAVWARIESRRPSPDTWGAWLRLNSFRFASLAVASVVLAGAGGGWIASRQTNRDREQLVQRYLASIDPHNPTHTQPR